MTIRIIIVLFAVLLMVGCSKRDVIESYVVPEPSRHLTPFESLQNISYFAFGGVGYAGVMSEGESAFQTLLTNTNALDMFNEILTNGTTEAKIYALCGIRELDPVAFTREADRFNTNRNVQTMRGCLLMHESANDLLLQIRSGAYDQDIRGESPGNLRTAP